MKIDKFEYKRIKEIILENFESSISFMIGGYYSTNFSNVRKDILKIAEKLDVEYGIDLVTFFKNYNNEIYKDSDFISSCAFVDCLLYWYDSEKGILGGYKLKDSETEFSKEEFVIKYKYGYCNYDLGKRYILQSYKSIEEYYEVTSKHFLYGLIESDWSLTSNKIDEIVKKCSITKKYSDNSYVIYIHLRYLYFLLDATYPDDIDNLKDNLGPIKYYIFDHLLEIYIGDKLHKISLQERDNIYNTLNIEYEFEKSIKTYNL